MILRIFCFTLLLAIMLLSQLSLAQQPTGADPALIDKLEFSGFGDMVLSIDPTDDQKTIGIEQFELDINTILSIKTQLSLALILDQGSIGVGLLTIEQSLISPEGNSSKPKFINELIIGGGQFDVPFGIDYLSYAAVDRHLISVPLVVEGTHDCWNDYGLYLKATNRKYDLTLYSVNGFDCHLQDEHDESEPEQLWTFGAQLGLSLFENFRLGGSAAYTNARSDLSNMMLLGIDLKYQSGGLLLKGEYINHKLASASGIQREAEGFYAQAEYSIGRWFLVSRYGELKQQEEIDLQQTRWSHGVGRSLSDMLELRVEHQIYGDTHNSTFFQTVVSF